MKTKIYLFASLLLAVLCFACSDDNGGGVQDLSFLNLILPGPHILQQSSPR